MSSEWKNLLSDGGKNHVRSNKRLHPDGLGKNRPWSDPRRGFLLGVRVRNVRRFGLRRGVSENVLEN